MSRVSAKRVAIVIVSGLALTGALGIAALRADASLISQSLIVQALEWAIPLAAGAVIGLSAWLLLGRAAPSQRDLAHEEVVCPSCGRAILGGWRLCPHCGAFVGGDAEQAL